MATGYTHPVLDGEITTLRDFALRCARGMGATIMMRDLPMDAPIPERFEASTKYHDEKITEARQALATLPMLEAAKADRLAGEEFEAAMSRHVEYEAKEAEGLARLRALRDQVAAWETGAEGLKPFMLEQLDLTIGKNGGWTPGPPARLTGEAWRCRALEKASRDLAYHETERAKEISRTEDRNRWLAALRESLPAPATTPAPESAVGMERDSAECTQTKDS